MRTEKLSKLLNISMGKTPARKKTEYWGKGHKWVSIRDLSKKVIDNTKEEITDLAISDTGIKPIAKGTLLFSFKLTIGKMAFAGTDLYTNEAIAAFVIKDVKKLDSNYLYYALKSANLVGSNQAAMGKTLNSKSLAEIRIPIPEDVDDQKRIAHLLGKVEGLIAQRKQHLQQLDDLLKSVFLEMFGDPVLNQNGWVTLTGKEYSDLLTVGVVIKPASYYQDEGVVALRSLNIKPNRIDLSNIVFFSKESSEGPLAKSILQTGDVVIVRTGKTGTAAVVPKELNGANCIDLIIVRPKSDVLNPFYLTSLLNSERGKALVSSKEVGGIQKHFNIGAMNKIQYPVPPIAFQNKFASIVEKVDSIRSQYRQSLSDLESLYGALSQKAFKGDLDLSKIVLDDSVDEPGSEPTQKKLSSEPPEPTLSMEPDELLRKFGSRSDFLKPLFERFLENEQSNIDISSFFNQLNLSEEDYEGATAETVADYDLVKQWLFDAIDAGAVVQENNEVSLRKSIESETESVEAGNEVVLRSA